MNMLNSETGEFQLSLSTGNDVSEHQSLKGTTNHSTANRFGRTSRKARNAAAAAAAAAGAAPDAAMAPSFEDGGDGDTCFSGGGRKAKSCSIKFSANDFVTQRYDSFNEHYEIIELLGEGAYGEVYICQHKQQQQQQSQQAQDEEEEEEPSGEGNEDGTTTKQQQQQRAVKIIQVQSDEDAQTVLSEFNILRGIDHPNLLKIYQLYEDEETNKFYIVSDLYRGGELYDELEQWGYFDEDDAAILINQVLTCLNYCHKNGIAHRDLKPENILIADTDVNFEDIKIIDFGLAGIFDEEEYDTARFNDKVGSAYYIAPEVFSGEHGPKVDIWACGVILYILLCGVAPFDGDDDMEIMEAIYEGTFNFDDEAWEDVSQEAKDFVTLLLTYEEEERPSAEEALKHPWIAKTRRESILGAQRRASQSGSTSYLANLEHFRADSKLKQAVCAFISSQLIMKHEKDVIDELFRAINTSCNGKISKEELKVGYKDFLDRELSDREVNDIFRRVNYSCSGAIEYSEFLVSAITLDESRLFATFKEFDKSGAGVLTASDLMEVLGLGCEDRGQGPKFKRSASVEIPSNRKPTGNGRRQQAPFSRSVTSAGITHKTKPNNNNAQKVVKQILAQFDTDHDGFISFEDFRDAMIPPPPAPPTTNKRFSRRVSKRVSEQSAVGRRSIRRSTLINQEDLEEALAACEEKGHGRLSVQSVSSSNPIKVKSNDMDGLLRSFHKVRSAKKKGPQKIRNTRSCAIRHAVSTSYARITPSRVKSHAHTTPASTTGAK